MINMFNQENFLMKNKIDNTIEWINKRLQLMGEGLTDKQKEYISFAFNMLMDTPPISPEDKKQMSGGFVKFIQNNNYLCLHRWVSCGERVFGEPKMDDNGKLSTRMQLKVCEKCGKLKHISI